MNRKKINEPHDVPDRPDHERSNAEILQRLRQDINSLGRALQQPDRETISHKGALQRFRQQIRAIEEELQRRNQEIIARDEELRRMNETNTDLSAFKNLMTTLMVHDLRNLLNMLINAEIRLDPVHRLSEMRNAGKRMRNVVDNMVGILGFESGSLVLNTRTVSCHEMVMNAFRCVRMQAATRDITLTYDHEGDFALLADAEVAERMLVNLLDNAIRFSPAGGPVEVTATMTNGFIKTTVKDHGDGVAPGLLPFIFNKYVHGYDPRQGTSMSYGLGLTFCKLAAEKHGGTTGAISEQGKGSEIWFTLPLASVDVNKTDDQIKPAVICDLQELPEFTEAELSWLREHYGPLRHFSIHQISDIKDLLDMPDAGASAAILRWKNAVIAATNQYNVSTFNHLVGLIK